MDLISDLYRPSSAIKILAAYPSAKVRVNGTLSDAFPIRNGTRQVCPLSPILFVLTLEPLLRKLTLIPDITGIRSPEKEYKYAAYADDILLFLTQPLTTLPILLSEFKHFQTLSNLKINFTKSFTLNISLPQNQVDQYKENFPFHWKYDSITYLGTQIPSKISDLYAKNFLPLLNKLTSDLKSWNKPTFSWFGRAALLKMNALPRVLYLLQMLPIQIPPSFFKTYRQICSSFLWGKHRHRIGHVQLTRPKNLGGIGLPNILHYHTATHLARIVDWNVHTQQKDWVSLEASFMKLTLSSLPWISPNRLPPEIRSHPTIGSTIQCFHQACKKSSISSYPVH